MYERFFGLGDAPFRLTPDPRYLFLSRKHADALAHLRLGLSESSGFVCITGDVGTGKTTVLRHFLGELSPEASVAYVINPTLSPLELLQTINLEFGLPVDDTKKQLVDRLNRHLLEQRRAHRRSVVVVDEAQALSMEVLEHLRLLSNLETTTEKLLRIVLVGQPQLRALLAHPELAQLNQRITLRWHIGPLDREETVAYVRHRLQVASDGQVRDVFSMPALRAVHRRSGGVPRLINMLCHRAMLAAFVAERRTVGLPSMRKAYREVVTLPLPGGLPSRPRAAWAGAAIAAGATGLLVGGLGGGLGVAPLLHTVTPGGALPGAVAASAAPDPAPEDPPAAAREPDPMSTEPDVTGEAAPPAPPADVAPTVEVAAAEPIAATPPPPPDPTPAVEAGLAALAPATSARQALDVVLRAWQVPPLAPDESAATADFAHVAERRGLEHLALTGNTAMLRLLDVPVVLELQLPGASGPRYAALVSMRDGTPVLAVGDGTPTAVKPALLERAWYGQAYVLSRDFEGLGPGTIDGHSRGARVSRLQGLLKRVGTYAGPESGLFDPPTSAAVLDFQRSRYVSADGIVGRLTRVALYAAAGGYPRPTLTTSAVGVPPAGSSTGASS
jgi:general secretion pathway protein A